MTRPYFSTRIDDLEKKFRAQPDDVAFLKELISELKHRTTYKARKLRSAVEKALAFQTAGARGRIERPAGAIEQSPVRVQPSSTDIASGPLVALSNSNPLLSLPVRALDLSTRARNVLANLGVTYVGELARLGSARLLREPNVGRTTARELAETLKSLGIPDGSVDPSWDRGTAARQEGLAIEFLRQLAQPSATPSQLIAALFAEVASVASSDRNLRIIVSQTGFDGRGGRTLDDVGTEHGLTRERVRQVVARTCERIRYRGMPPAVVMEAIALAKNLAPVCEAAFEDALQKAGLEDKPFELSGLPAVARLYGIEFPFGVCRAGNTRVLIPDGTISELERLPSRAAKQSGSRGCADLDSLLSALDWCQSPHGREVAIAFLSAREGFEWLDRASGWFWYRPAFDGRRNRLVNLIRRVMAVASRVRISELRSAIRRNVRMHGFAPPTSILRAICEVLPFADLQGDYLSRKDTALNWADEPSPSDAVFARVFRQHGPVLHRTRLMELCLSEGMNENTFIVWTSYSVVLWRPAKGYYSLIGETIPPGTIEEQKRNHQSDGPDICDSGWLPDGQPYVCWRITRTKFGSGIFRIPVGLQPLLQGQYSMLTVATEPTGSVSVTRETCWNLTRLLRRTGAEPGDILLVKFDPLRRVAIGVVGSTELLQALADGDVTSVFSIPADVAITDGEDGDLEELDQ